MPKFIRKMYLIFYRNEIYFYISKRNATSCFINEDKLKFIGQKKNEKSRKSKKRLHSPSQEVNKHTVLTMHDTSIRKQAEVEGVKHENRESKSAIGWVWDADNCNNYDDDDSFPLIMTCQRKDKAYRYMYEYVCTSTVVVVTASWIWIQCSCCWYNWNLPNSVLLWRIQFYFVVIRLQFVISFRRYAIASFNWLKAQNETNISNLSRSLIYFW